MISHSRKEHPILLLLESLILFYIKVFLNDLKQLNITVLTAFMKDLKYGSFFYNLTPKSIKNL